MTSLQSTTKSGKPTLHREQGASLTLERFDAIPSRMSTPKRTTIYLDAALHRALRLKSAETDASISALVRAAVRTSLAEDADDLAVFEERAPEPRVSLASVTRASVARHSR